MSGLITAEAPAPSVLTPIYRSESRQAASGPHKTDCRGAAANSDICRCCVVTPMDLQGRPRRPAISLGAGAPHEHCPLSIAQAVGAKKGLDGLLVVHDSKCARP